MILSKINNLEFHEEELNNILENLNNLINDLLSETSTTNQLQIIDEINKSRDHYLTLYWCSYLGYLKNIQDEKYLSSEKLFGQIDPKYNNLIYKYYQSLDKLKKQDLIDAIGQRTFDLAHNQSMLLNDENNEFIAKERELCREYRKLIIGTKFEFNQETINLSKLSKYFKNNDRQLRKQAYDKRFEVLLSIQNSINNIVDELVKIRTKIANNLNLNNYKEYGFIKMNRLGYNEKDLNKFKANVVKYFVPLMNKLRKKQQERLKLDAIQYYDENYLFDDGNAVPKLQLNDLIETLKNIYLEIDQDIYNLFCNMYDNGLIDLENRENKSNGGLTTYLPDFKYPTFIKKYQDLEENFTSITHEFGHSVQLYFSKNQKYHENRWPTFDICEIHSTSMELLMYPYIDQIFKNDSNKYYIRHLTSLINTIILMCATDDFQSKIYEKPNMNHTQRNNTWKEIYKRYFPECNYDHKYYELGIMWQSDSNRIDDPFYGIDYSLATISALSFYKKELTDKNKAIKDYINLCKEGGSKSLKLLIHDYNLCNPFVESDIKQLSEFIDKEIDKYIFASKNKI